MNTKTQRPGRVSSSSSARRAPTPKRGRSNAPKRRRKGSSFTPFRQATARYRREIVALLAVVVGVLCGFGTYASAGGAVGRWADTGAGILLGALRLAAPLVLIGGGLALLIDEPEGGRRLPRRIALGLVFAVTAVLGLLHVSRYPVGTDRPIEGLVRAGGAGGAVVGYPLYRFASRPGAYVVLAAVLIGAVALLTGTSPRVAVNRVARFLAPFGRRLVAGIQNLFQVEGMIGGDGEAQGDFDNDDFDNDDAEAQQRRPPPRQRAAPIPPIEPLAAPETIEMQMPMPPALLDREDFATPAAGISPNWKLPAAKLLERGATQEIDRALVERTGRTLEHALAEHGVETRLVGMVVGPTVTRYELELGPGVKVARVTSLHKDIAYAMATPDVRILAPIPGRQAIGVEVPNTKRQLVTLGDILASEEALAADHPLK